MPPQESSRTSLLVPTRAAALLAGALYDVLIVMPQDAAEHNAAEIAQFSSEVPNTRPPKTIICRESTATPSPRSVYNPFTRPMFRRSFSGALFLLLFVFTPQFVLAGSQAYATPGTYTFTVPNYVSLTVTVDGAGGADANGGVDAPGLVLPGRAGGASQFNGTVTGNGGTGGWQSFLIGHEGAFTYYVQNGTPGTASGGDINTTGGGAPGGAGQNTGYVALPNGAGGNGGRAVKTYAQGALSPGSSVLVIVGAGGVGYFSKDNSGQNGQVTISWTAPPPPPPPPPTCAMTAAPTSIQVGQSSTLSWVSHAEYNTMIMSIGAVNPSGSVAVTPSQTTTYIFTGVDQTGTSHSCSATVTVEPSNSKCPAGQRPARLSSVSASTAPSLLTVSARRAILSAVSLANKATDYLRSFSTKEERDEFSPEP